jgi:serine-type D-Ala-D-Ala carboxypeptidase (penicillin-binding protein 5/6)
MTGRVALAVGLAWLAIAANPAAPAAAGEEPQIDARAWALIDARTGDVLVSHAVSRHLPIASTTKLMTAYVALHELPLGKAVRAAPYSPIYGESLLELRAGQRVSVRDLLYGLILRSGNDAAYDLALAAAGSERRFVRQMNLRAAALGLSDTHYANPIGLDQAGNFSSAGDLTALARRLLRVPAFARIADSRSAVLRSLHPRRRIATIDDFLLEVPWSTGVKTGHTFGARYVLVGSGRRKGVELISAVIGAPTETDRDLGTVRLLEYGFSRYRRRTPIRAGVALATPSIRYAGGELPLRAARTAIVGIRPGQRLTVAIRAPDEVEGPVRRGAPLGRTTVVVDGLRVASVPLRAGRRIPRAGTLDRVLSVVRDNPIPFAIGLFVILMGAALLLRRRRRRGAEEDEMVSREERQALRRRRRQEEAVK